MILEISKTDIDHWTLNNMVLFCSKDGSRLRYNGFLKKLMMSVPQRFSFGLKIVGILQKCFCSVDFLREIAFNVSPWSIKYFSISIFLTFLYTIRSFQDILPNFILLQSVDHMFFWTFISMNLRPEKWSKWLHVLKNPACTSQIRDLLSFSVWNASPLCG